MSGGPPTDPIAFRRAIGRFATGVSVITALDVRGRRYAMTANSITSVSLEPPLVLVCFMRDSDTGRAVRETGLFALNVLSSGQGEELARRFARKSSGSGEDQLEGAEVSSGPHGLPLLDGCVEQLVCRTDATHVVGDHDVVVAHAESVEAALADAEPAVWYGGRFWRLRPL